MSTRSLGLFGVIYAVMLCCFLLYLILLRSYGLALLALTVLGLLYIHGRDIHQVKQQMAESDQKMREFVANIAHEIQTPLTSIQGYADAILEQVVGNQQIHEYAMIIGRQARHLAALSRQFLLLSTLEHTDLAVEKKTFQLLPHVRQTLRMIEWSLTEKDLSIRIRIPEPLLVYGDEVLLHQIWSNLLMNAIKHSRTGSTIDIRAFRESKGCFIDIEDFGEGIAKEHLSSIFDRYFTVHTDKLQPGSAGLGLSVVKKIIQLHGGTVEVESKHGEGTRFRVWIPDAEKAAV